MRHIQLLILFASLTMSSRAQQTFIKAYESLGSARLNLMELNNHELSIAGISVMDSMGNIIRSRYFEVNLGGFLALQSVKMDFDNEYYFSGAFNGDTCGLFGGMWIHHIYPVLGKVDSAGHVQSAMRYVLNDVSCQNIGWDLLIANDKGAFTWGVESPFVLRTDSNLAYLWSKHFQGNGGIAFIKELPGGDLLAGINLQGAGASVLRMDAGGNMLWCKSYMHPKGVVYDCVVESDSLFFLTGFTDSIPAFHFGGPDFHPELFLLKLNGTGEVQWCRGYNSDYDWVTDRPIKLIRTHDGNNVLLATIGQAGRHPFLMKIDTNGDTLWTRMVGPFGYGNVMETADLIETSDGGLLFDCMQMFLGVFLYKTDSMGQFSCLEETPPPITTTELFPIDSSFTIPSVDGAVAYPVLVANAIRDTTMFTADGCQFTAVSNTMVPGKLHLHPNPTTGHFTMELPSPLSADSFYSVYDAVGKLLFQRPLAKGAESEQIDLSRFGKGTYLVRITSKDGVCNERVVVQ